VCGALPVIASSTLWLKRRLHHRPPRGPPHPRRDRPDSWKKHRFHTSSVLQFLPAGSLSRVATGHRIASAPPTLASCCACGPVPPPLPLRAMSEPFYLSLAICPVVGRAARLCPASVWPSRRTGPCPIELHPSRPIRVRSGAWLLAPACPSAVPGSFVPHRLPDAPPSM